MYKIFFTVILLLFTKLIHSQNNLDTIYFDESWEKIDKEKSVYFNLGDWMVNFTYLIYDGNEAKLARFMD